MGESRSVPQAEEMGAECVNESRSVSQGGEMRAK